MCESEKNDSLVQMDESFEILENSNLVCRNSIPPEIIDFVVSVLTGREVSSIERMNECPFLIQILRLHPLSPKQSASALASLLPDALNWKPANQLIFPSIAHHIGTCGIWTFSEKRF